MSDLHHRAESIGVQSARPSRFRAFMGKEWVFAWLLVIPTLIAVIAVIGYPWFYSMWMSLNHLDLYKGTKEFVGLANYLKIFRDPLFRISLARTVTFSVVSVVGNVVLGMGMALVLNEAFKGRGFLRTIVLVPWAIAQVGNAILWDWILSGQFGAVNALLYQLGIIDKYIGFFTGPSRAMATLIFVYVWRQAPLATLLLLAGLQGIPPSLYGAAKVDGASAFQRFRNITLPLLRPILLISLVLATINAFMHFDLFYVTTRGGPGYATMVIPIHGYRVTFHYLRFGEGTAILYSLSLICLGLAFVYLRLLYRPEQAAVAAARAVPEEVGTPSRGLGTLRAGVAPVGIPREKPRIEMRRALINPRIAKLLRRVTLYTMAIIIMLWTLLPLYWLVNCSLSNMPELIARPPRFFPLPPRFINYTVTLRGIFGEIALGAEAQYFGAGKDLLLIMPGLFNSIIVAVGVTVVCVVLGSFSGWAYARYRERSGLMNFTLMILLVTRMIPGLTLVVPIFIFFRSLGLIDSKLGLIVAYTSFILPFIVWILKGYFEGIPPSLERAALVDGCTRLGSIVRVVLPVAVPGLAAAALFSFIVAFNEFAFALILTQTMASQTVTVALQALHFGIGQIGSFNWMPALLAATVLGLSVPVTLALAFQRYLVQGLLAGHVKG